MSAPSLPGRGAPGNREIMITRNFTDNGIMGEKNRKIEEGESGLIGKILKYQPKKYDS
jgi:hypothetical protein